MIHFQGGRNGFEGWLVGMQDDVIGKAMERVRGRRKRILLRKKKYMGQQITNGAVC